MTKRKKSSSSAVAPQEQETISPALDYQLRPYKTEFLLEHLNQKNPRWMADDQREALNLSLQKFGCVEPIIFNVRTQQVVGGHQRIISSHALGLEELAVKEVDLSEDEELALNIFLNKVKGQWDLAKAAKFLSKLSPEAIAATGFSLSESNTLIQNFMVEAEAVAEEGESSTSTGLVNQLRNLSQEESEEEIAAFTYVQFGQFSFKAPTAQYEAWVAQLISESEFGVSPFGLGQVVARRLGILDAVSEKGETSDNSANPFSTDPEDMEIPEGSDGDQSDYSEFDLEETDADLY